MEVKPLLILHLQAPQLEKSIHGYGMLIMMLILKVYIIHLLIDMKMKEYMMYH